MIMCGALLNPSPRAFVGPLGVCLAGLFETLHVRY
jgi:hypothetical protein